jgi:nicotinamidase/pyrazinamidase
VSIAPTGGSRSSPKLRFTVREALLIIDVQNDFVPGGALPVPRGDEILGRVRELIESGRFDLVVATRDWHPADHRSFEEQGGPWPPHCVQGTAGAELHPSLPRDQIDVVVDAGYRPELEGYSGFEQTELASVLREHDIERVTVVGLATDYCVRHTALDALGEGFDVVVDKQGIRGIDVQPGDSERALEELESRGATVA